MKWSRIWFPEKKSLSVTFFNIPKSGIDNMLYTIRNHGHLCYKQVCNSRWDKNSSYKLAMVLLWVAVVVVAQCDKMTSFHFHTVVYSFIIYITKRFVNWTKIGLNVINAFVVEDCCAETLHTFVNTNLTNSCHDSEQNENSSVRWPNLCFVNLCGLMY